MLSTKIQFILYSIFHIALIYTYLSLYIFLCNSYEINAYHGVAVIHNKLEVKLKFVVIWPIKTQYSQFKQHLIICPNKSFEKVYEGR